MYVPGVGYKENLHTKYRFIRQHCALQYENGIQLLQRFLSPFFSWRVHYLHAFKPCQITDIFMLMEKRIIAFLFIFHIHALSSTIKNIQYCLWDFIVHVMDFDIFSTYLCRHNVSILKQKLIYHLISVCKQLMDTYTGLPTNSHSK